MSERLHEKSKRGELTVADAVDLIRLYSEQPSLSGFLTRRDVERAAGVLAKWFESAGERAADTVDSIGDEDYGWFCPIHGWYTMGSPDDCLDEHCNRFRPITELERKDFELGFAAPRPVTLTVEQRAKIEALLAARDVLDREIARIRGE